MTKPVVKLPDSKGGWASLVIGLGMLMMGIGHMLQGDYEDATGYFTGAFGTMGLPSLFGKGYHVEIRRDHVADLSPPKGFEGVGRLTDTNEDIDAEDIKPVPKPGPKPGPVSDAEEISW